MRSRISSGSFSSPRRAPIRATSFTTSGAGVATATSNHSSMESKNPPSAPISSRNADRKLLQPKAGADQGNILHHQRGRGCDGDQQPQQHGEQEPAQRADLQQKCVAGFEVTNHAIGEEENEHGYGGQRHEPDIDAAMQALTRAAELTLHQVRLVVAAHFGSET